MLQKCINDIRYTIITKQGKMFYDIGNWDIPSSPLPKVESKFYV